MNFNNMSDNEIISTIAKELDKRRVSKNITSEELAAKGGHNAQTFSNFVNQGTNVRLGTIIQIFRGLGELDKLQGVFEHKELISPIALSNQAKMTRVRASSAKRRATKVKTEKSFIKWGDES